MVENVYVVNQAGWRSGATAGFEEEILKHNRKGLRLDKWSVDDLGNFHLLFSGTGENDMSESALRAVNFQELEVAPWQIFVMKNPKRVSVAKGEVFNMIRLVTDYEYISSGDQVSLTAIHGCNEIGLCEVLSIQKIVIKNLTRMDIMELSPIYKAYTKEGVIKVLRRHYQADSIGEDTAVAIMRLKVLRGNKKPSIFECMRRAFRRMRILLLAR